MNNKEVVATKTEGKLFHLLNDGNVTDEGGLTVCNCSNMFVSKKKSVLNADHLVKCWNENEELKAQCDTYKKDYESLVKEVVRLSGENSKMKELIADRIKELEG